MKLTDTHRDRIRERRLAGFSLRAIASWLEATEGVTVTAKTIKDVLDRDKERAAAAASAVPPSSPARKRSERTPVETEEAETDEDGGDAGDYDLMTRIIDDLDADIEKARENGNVQGQSTLERLRLDALRRRRELRPPAPPTEVDAEMLDAGRRAVDKLRALLAAELERGAVAGEGEA